MTEQFLWTHLPYCIEYLDVNKYIILNRNHTPIGTTNNDYVNYNTHPSVVYIRITKKQAKKLSYNGESALGTIFLFNNPDDLLNNPKAFKDYMKRLKLLAKLKYVYI